MAQHAGDGDRATQKLPVGKAKIEVETVYAEPKPAWPLKLAIKEVDPKALPATRLIVDMLPLSAQVQIACDTARGAAARLAGVEIPKHEDTEATISELKARVAKTLEFIRTIKPEQLQGAETREVILQFPESKLSSTASTTLRTSRCQISSFT
jgi:hypothetical protein